jgi:ABC-type nitrate/sulfonate/bicarbonate transport system permease component
MQVVAELLAATDGLGYRLTVLRRGSEWDQIFAVLVVFAVIGITSDLFLRWLRNRVSPWARS